MTGIIRSTKSEKTMATATGTLVMQRSLNSQEDPTEACQWFESRIQSRPVLRQIGEVQYRIIAEGNGQPARIELTCVVEYGPVFGAYKTDLLQQLKVIGANTDGAFKVFDFKRTEVRLSVDELRAKVHDVTLPLSERERYDDIVRKLESRTK